ncbi:MAG: hypothetical protein HC915_05695 [Anaerolineae bacterium]|nr:hypothetical protein [Anaerolineae bacterium]
MNHQESGHMPTNPTEPTEPDSLVEDLHADLQRIENASGLAFTMALRMLETLEEDKRLQRPTRLRPEKN